MKVALLGYGNVGGGAYDIICEMKGGLAVKHILARSSQRSAQIVRCGCLRHAALLICNCDYFHYSSSFI